MIWIMGEYAERIDKVEDILDGFLENFHDEATTVQLQLPTKQCPKRTLRHHAILIDYYYCCIGR